MSLSHPTIIHVRRKPNRGSYPSPLSAALDTGVRFAKEVNPAALRFEGSKERIRNLFNKVELSVSSYDTAWVAMVPSPQNSEAPRFPRCVNWLLDNQLNDGSWGLPHHSPIWLKDVLSSTLACVLALKRWGIGEEHINKGLHFIELNVASVTDINKPSPIGFDIIFPSMLKYAEDLNLKLPLEPTALTAMLQKRELELTRCCESHSQVRGAYLGYISEGMGKLQDWEMVMKYQRKNGSLFNSPSTTAAALTHLKNDGCLNYLCSLLEKFGNAVPTVYPSDIYMRLCVVDNLERLGIDRHFNIEIRNVLEEAYRCWLQGEDEIFMDAATCAMAFRILRMSGYDVSSDALTQVIKEESCYNSLGGHLKETSDVLELYRASQLTIYEDESALEEQNSLSSDFLKQNLLNRSIPSNRLARHVSQEVDDALNFPFHASLERIANRRNIEHYNVDNTRILKSSYCSTHFSNKDFLKLAVEDFNICQSIHREELEYLERWVVELSLDKLKFARQRAAYCYFSAAATFFSPELSDARISWAKNGVLTTVVDDFFDVGGSIEELLNLIQLVEKWDVNGETDFCSEEVRIIFLALRQTICEIGEQAFRWQARSVTSHIVEIWLNLLHSMLKEAEWARDMFVPTINEYMTNGYVSFALGPIVLPALYLVGPELSEEVVRSDELNNLFKLMSTPGRLLNDIQSFKRESREGKLNAVSLHMMHSSGSVTEEEAIGEMKGFIDSQRRELLRLVLQERDSIVPRVCKDLFWKMSKVVHLFYIKDDGFTSDDMIRTVKAIIHEPIGSF